MVSACLADDKINACWSGGMNLELLVGANCAFMCDGKIVFDSTVKSSVTRDMHLNSCASICFYIQAAQKTY